MPICRHGPGAGRRESGRDGAIGFSTNRLPGHRLPDGRAIPGTYASPEELVAIAKKVGQYNGLMQTVPWYDAKAILSDLEYLGLEADAGKLRVLFSVVETASFGFDDPHQIVEDHRAQGHEIYGVTVPRPGGFVSNLKTNLMFPAFKALRALPIAERLQAIQSDEFRQQLIDAARADPGSERYAKSLRYMGAGDERPTYTRDRSDNLAKMAADAGEHPAETWLRVMLETKGAASFHVPFFNMNFEEVEKLMDRDWVVPGLGDAGAHVGQIMDSGWPSFLLAHWVRDEQRLSLSQAVHRMTARAARVLGLTDRGLLSPGYKADINVFDPSAVEERVPTVEPDFPHDNSRLVQRAVGYKATLVNGQVILRDDEHTGARAGQVIRSQY